MVYLCWRYRGERWGVIKVGLISTAVAAVWHLLLAAAAAASAAAAAWSEGWREDSVETDLFLATRPRDRVHNANRQTDLPTNFPSPR